MNTQKILRELNALPPVFKTRANLTKLLYELAGRTPPPILKTRTASAPMSPARFRAEDLPELIARARDPFRRHLVRREELEVLRSNGVAV